MDPSKHTAPYTIEHVVALDPLRPNATTDVFLIQDDDGVEAARVFTVEDAALVCAAFNIAARNGYDAPHPKRVRCPQCLGETSAVVETRVGDGGTLRRRKCRACGARFKTIETLVILTTEGESVDG